MITVTYSMVFAGGTNLATRVSDLQNAPLDQGELTVLGLTVASDVTSTIPDGSNVMIQRVVGFNETADFVARMGTPYTDAKRISAVTGLFGEKLSKHVQQQISEQIVLT